MNNSDKKRNLFVQSALLLSQLRFLLLAAVMEILSRMPRMQVIAFTALKGMKLRRKMRIIRTAKMTITRK